MTEPTVWTFFYGSFINLDVLKEVDLVPAEVEAARLSGFDIRIQPLANLVRSDEHCVYGIVAKTTHAELARLYDYAQDHLGGKYLPEAVVVETRGGALRPALCYIAPELEPKLADKDYVDRIVGPAKHLGFPDWYVRRLESFRP
ncbi:MAG: gamma-glutamylcyclotransferase [Phycisphaerae bacterium]|jgi:hypothetical protein